MRSRRTPGLRASEINIDRKAASIHASVRVPRNGVHGADRTFSGVSAHRHRREAVPFSAAAMGAMIRPWRPRCCCRRRSDRGHVGKSGAHLGVGGTATAPRLVRRARGADRLLRRRRSRLGGRREADRHAYERFRDEARARDLVVQASVTRPCDGGRGRGRCRSGEATTGRRCPTPKSPFTVLSRTRARSSTARS